MTREVSIKTENEDAVKNIDYLRKKGIDMKKLLENYFANLDVKQVSICQ